MLKNNQKEKLNVLISKEILDILTRVSVEIYSFVEPQVATRASCLRLPLGQTDTESVAHMGSCLCMQLINKKASKFKIGFVYFTHLFPMKQR